MKKAAFERQLVDRLDEAETEIIHGPIPPIVRAAIYANAMAVYDSALVAERRWRSCAVGMALAWAAFVASNFTANDTVATVMRALAFGAVVPNAYHAGRWSTRRSSFDAVTVSGGVLPIHVHDNEEDEV